jgi:hypothetical protein
VKVLAPSIARFGRVVSPMHAKVTTRVLLGVKSHILGGSHWRQGLVVATCEDSANDAKAEVGASHQGLTHESVGAMTADSRWTRKS